MSNSKVLQKYPKMFMELYRMLGQKQGVFVIPFADSKLAQKFRFKCYAFAKALKIAHREEVQAEIKEDLRQMLSAYNERIIKLEGNSLRFVLVEDNEEPWGGAVMQALDLANEIEDGAEGGDADALSSDALREEWRGFGAGGSFIDGLLAE